MKKERLSMLKLIKNDDIGLTNDVKEVDNSIQDKVYQSNPVKSNLYSKLLAYRQSQKKFGIKDLINDSLK